MNINKIIFDQNRLVWFLMITLAIGGVFSYKSMSKLEDPEIKIKSALIFTPYPGASAEEVEKNVTDILETEIKSMGRIDEVTSRSVPNLSEIQVTMELTVPDKGLDLDQYWDILRKRIAETSKKLPEGAMDPIVFDDFGDVYGLFYAMTSDGYSYDEMSDYADELKKRLQSLEGVRRVNINGKQQSIININISETKMAELGLHPAQILLSLRSQLSSVYAGNYQTEGNQIRIAVNHRIKSVEEIENLCIQGIGHSQLRLKDIAKIEQTYQTPTSSKMKYNCMPALGISISMESGGNIIEVGERVAQCVNEFHSELPVGIEFQKVYFQSEEVQESINGFTGNLAMSLFIVVFVIMLAMGFRSGLVIGISLLLTVLGTFPMLAVMGGTIQRVSLASFIVAMGMLVDNAIVVVDTIWEDLRKGKDKREVVTKAVNKVWWPLLGATLIAISSFLPVYLSPDTTGTYTRDLFLVLAISLLLSWILAIIQVPLFSLKILKVSKKQTEKDPLDTPFYKWLKRSLEWILCHKTVTIIAILIAFGISGFSFKYIKMAFFPELTYKQAFLEYKLPDGTSIDRVEHDLDEISEYLMQNPNINAVTSNLGGSPTRYNLMRLVPDRNTSYGEIIIDFKDYKTRIEQTPIIESHIRSRYPEAYTRIKNYKIMFSECLVELQFMGNDIDTLKRLASSAEMLMKEAEGCDIPTVKNNWQPKMPYLDVEYRLHEAKRAGINRSDLGYSLMSATGGLPVASYFEGDKELPIYLKMTDEYGHSVKDLNNIPIWGLNSLNIPLAEIFNNDIPLDEVKDNILKSAPLSSAADISIKWEEPVIRRVDGVRAIKAQCDPLRGYTANKIVKHINDNFDRLNIPEGYTYRWQGEKGDQARAMKYIIMLLPISLVVILLLLLALFRSYRKTLIIILCVPLSVIGIVPSVIISGYSFGFAAIVGVIGLMGMMIKNSVVLIDEIDYQISTGMNANDAIVMSSLLRVRPVFMASITTVLGMLPLITDAFFGCLAVTIMGGLLVGSIVTIAVVPLLYFIFFHTKKPKLGDIKAKIENLKK